MARRRLRSNGWLKEEIAMERLCLDAAREGRPFQWIRFTVDHRGVRYVTGALVNCEFIGLRLGKSCQPPRANGTW